ncbi:MAG: hypothetical protein ABEI86_12495 [Halobacteriaceae archaeon]
MSYINRAMKKSLVKWNSMFFLLAAILFLVNAIIVVIGMFLESAQMIKLLGETFNAAGWAVGLLGLLGLYQEIADQSRILSRVGVVCATIGVIVFTALSGLTFSYFIGILNGNIESLIPLILPGTIIGGVLSFLLFGIASLRTQVLPRTIGILLLSPPLIIISNITTGILGFDSTYILLGVIGALLFVMASIGFKLQFSNEKPNHVEPTPEQTAN